ncbi:MAG: ABC-2 transporter permease [Eubacterium sp.]|nr:ABC-2 transporter permease [Eubacterium sp.]
MKKLLYKEMKLTAHPLSYFFILFALMAMIPGYPIAVGGYFVCLGLFYTYQQARECDDITYTVMLPVRKRDAVKAKYVFAIFIECVAFLLSLILTMVRMNALGGAVVYASNPMMNANAAYLGYLLMIYGLFHLIFIRGFFRTAYKYGKPFVVFTIAGFVLIGIGEVLHHIPGLTGLNDPAMVNAPQLVILVLGLLFYVGGTAAAYAASVKDFERIDL